MLERIVEGDEQTKKEDNGFGSIPLYHPAFRAPLPDRLLSFTGLTKQ
jgi:hypothetical protein